MKPLTLEETAVKEEMKERCLAKGQYIDEKAKDKFKMLCHLEDFEVQYWELQEENKQLKDNWNKLKEYCKENTLCYEVGDDENTKLIGSKIHGLNVLDKMQELEQGSDSDE